MSVKKLIEIDQFELDKQILANNLKKQDMDSLNCPTCSSQWFEQIQIMKVPVNHSVVLGQKVPNKLGTSFVMLKCVNCSAVIEPRISRNPRDLLGDDYNHFLDTFEGKNDSRIDKEDAIPTEKL